MKTTTLVAALAFTGIGASAHAYDVTDQLSITPLVAGAVQCQYVSDTDADDDCRAGIPFQPEFSFHPDERNEVAFKLGFADGNGLNNNSPFVIAPWAADLEDDVTNINGNNRDYLLTALYKHTLPLGEDNALGATFGIIDSTDYLDDNAYSNDEYTQFLNAALVNGPNQPLPSYDGGGALEWDTGSWSLRGVFMHVDENDDGNSFNFYGAQLGYTVETTLGEGTYRVLVVSTSNDFINEAGTDQDKINGVGLSFDQQLGENLGGWLRLARTNDDAAVDYANLFSGGIDIQGGRWGRPDDNIGLGYAYLDGGNLDVDASHVAEVYYRFVVNDYLAITADLQFMKDDRDEIDSPDGFIGGLRVVTEI